MALLRSCSQRLSLAAPRSSLVGGRKFRPQRRDAKSAEMRRVRFQFPSANLRVLCLSALNQPVMKLRFTFRAGSARSPRSAVRQMSRKQKFVFVAFVAFCESSPECSTRRKRRKRRILSCARSAPLSKKRIALRAGLRHSCRMLAKVCSAAINGIEAYPVEVEVNAGFGEGSRSGRSEMGTELD